MGQAHQQKQLHADVTVEVETIDKVVVAFVVVVDVVVVGLVVVVVVVGLVVVVVVVVVVGFVVVWVVVVTGGVVTLPSHVGHSFAHGIGGGGILEVTEHCFIHSYG